MWATGGGRGRRGIGRSVRRTHRDERRPMDEDMAGQLTERDTRLQRDRPAKEMTIEIFRTLLGLGYVQRDHGVLMCARATGGRRHRRRSITSAVNIAAMMRVGSSAARRRLTQAVCSSQHAPSIGRAAFSSSSAPRRPSTPAVRQEQQQQQHHQQPQQQPAPQPSQFQSFRPDPKRSPVQTHTLSPRLPTHSF